MWAVKARESFLLSCVFAESLMRLSRLATTHLPVALHLVALMKRFSTTFWFNPVYPSSPVGAPGFELKAQSWFDQSGRAPRSACTCNVTHNRRACITHSLPNHARPFMHALCQYACVSGMCRFSRASFSHSLRFQTRMHQQTSACAFSDGGAGRKCKGQAGGGKRRGGQRHDCWDQPPLDTTSLFASDSLWKGTYGHAA